ncbi:hypothetical protein MHM39_03940 [Phaeobacter sp. CNT1-3]|nr:hypothetical protein [Phaeobacter sp. CNT1-3]
MVDKHVDFYLEPGLKSSTLAGQHNFICKVIEVLEKGGFTTAIYGNSAAERDESRRRDSYAMFHMDQPLNDRGLTMRRVYHYPFWQIEPTTERWDWRVAKARFKTEKVEPAEARKFYNFWRKRLFGEAVQDISRDGFVYVPLQGRLLERRSFQTCSPIEMLVAVLQRDPGRKVIATLHPNEVITPAEHAQLKTLTQRFPRLSVQKIPMEQALARCDYVVTQNSSVAFNGYFFGKPCVLFARVDFHHIAGDVFRNGRDAAFETVLSGDAPDYAGYVWWFWQEMSINAGRDGADRKIRQAIRRAGWPL